MPLHAFSQQLLTFAPECCGGPRRCPSDGPLGLFDTEYLRRAQGKKSKKVKR